MATPASFKKGHVPWNKGLTKESNRIVKYLSDQKKGKKKSLEIRQKMSKSRIERIKNGTIKVWNKGKEYLQIRGEKHWRWLGGKGSQQKNKSLAWKTWRQAVFQRDNFICQRKNCEYCKNKKGVKLHPHHIKSKSKYPELMFVVDNGITYCEDYHLKGGLHRK